MARREEQIRGGIVCLLRAGHSNAQISVLIGAAKSTISDVSKRFKQWCEDGNDPDDYDIRVKESLMRKRRSDAHGNDEISLVQEKIDIDPGISMNQIAKDLGFSRDLVQKIVHEDIRYKSYALKCGQYLSPSQKEARLQRSKHILNDLKKPSARGGGPDRLIFFSDEKNFQQDQVVNRRNDRWLCADITEVPVVMRTKYPQTLMVLGVVTSEGEVMPPHIFERGSRLNAEGYIHVLSTVVKPWIETIANGRPYVFQQDGAPPPTPPRLLKSGWTRTWDRTGGRTFGPPPPPT